MVEESENLDAENVTDYSQMLQEILGPSIRVGYLHGKMKEKEKDEIMTAFGRNEIRVLVSTTVVEVGIDVLLHFHDRLQVKRDKRTAGDPESFQ